MCKMVWASLSQIHTDEKSTKYPAGTRDPNAPRECGGAPQGPHSAFERLSSVNAL